MNTFGDDAAQGHPFMKPIVSDGGLSFGWEFGKLIQDSQSNGISFIWHLDPVDVRGLKGCRRLSCWS